MKILNRQTLAWAFYDWANSAFALVVLAGFFPVFYRQYLAVGQESSSITFQLGLANSAASLVIVFLAPILGAYADIASRKKKLLMLFAWLGVIMTFGMYWLGEGQWQAALILYSLGSFGFLGANVFYDSLLVDVSDKSLLDRISALGYALGYIGSALMFSFCVWMTLSPETFGLESSTTAVRLSFLLVAVWWAVFSIPLMLWVKEPGSRDEHVVTETFVQSLAQVKETIVHVLSYKPVLIFLLAYFMYIDAVDTIVRMAVDYGQALGFDSKSLIKALLLTQFVAFPAALVFGWLGQKIGTRKALLIGLVVYMFITAWAATISETWEFYAMAVMIGLVQGGVQALSRSFYAKLIPHDKAAEFFGFYNMLGKSAVLIGPLMVGAITVWTGSNRISMRSLLVLFIIGAILLYLVPVPPEDAPEEDK